MPWSTALVNVQHLSGPPVLVLPNESTSTASGTSITLTVTGLFHSGHGRGVLPTVLKAGHPGRRICTQSRCSSSSIL